MGGPEPVNTNWGPGPLSTNWGLETGNSNWETRTGGEGQDREQGKGPGAGKYKHKSSYELQDILKHVYLFPYTALRNSLIFAIHFSLNNAYR